MTFTKRAIMFGDSETHARYEALRTVIDRALEQHKLSGVQIGFNVLGARHPLALSNLLPASKGARAHTDHTNLGDQIRSVLMSDEITNKYGVYDLVLNHDEDIEPRFDFYIVPVPVGQPILDLRVVLNSALANK